MKAHKLCGLQAALPDTKCIDVGASYYPHTSWWLFLDSPHTKWVAVEPNAANLTYLKMWPWAAAVSAVHMGLSRDGGTQILHVTNTDSGSSLLRPRIPPSMEHRSDQSLRNYMFPITEIPIDTVTLESIVSDGQRLPVMVKLDTQGSELDILKSVVHPDSSHDVVGVEIECSLLAEPYYEGSPRLWDVASYLESNGFEAIQIDVFPRGNSRAKISSKPRVIVKECDAIFAMRRDVAAGRSVEVRASLLGFYVTNCFYAEAHSLLSADAELREFLGSRDCDVRGVESELLRRSGSET